MDKMRMVIFGCGYVGRDLARAAVAAGHEVWILSRNADALARVDAVPANRRIVANLHERDWHRRLPGRWDVAFNLVSSAGGGLDGYRISYLEGNRSIAHWASQACVGRLVYTSATSVYPQSDGAWVAEDDVPGLEELSPSGRILREAELEVLACGAFAQRMVARLAGIYGPGRHLYLDRLREGATSIPGDGNAWLNLIYLKDITRLLLQLAGLPMDQETLLLNVVDDRPARKQEIVDWLAQRLGMPAIPFDPDQQSARAGRRMGGGGLPKRRVSNARLKALLDWEPQFPDYRAGYTDILEVSEPHGSSGQVFSTL